MTQVTERPRYRGKPVDAVVDVRSKLEFWLGHLPGAVCVPVDSIPEGLSKHGISPGSRILVYCASGARSAAAERALRAAGYRNVVDGGGFSAASEHFTPAGGR